MQPVISQPVDAVEKVLGELPVPWFVTTEDIRLAVRAVVVHAPESWPAGPMCRSDRTPYPCRLHRWGRRVLRSRGLSEQAVDELVSRGDRHGRVPDRRR